jgi:hypothetical protein
VLEIFGEIHDGHAAAAELALDAVAILQGCGESRTDSSHESAW